MADPRLARVRRALGIPEEGFIEGPEELALGSVGPRINQAIARLPSPESIARILVDDPETIRFAPSQAQARPAQAADVEFALPTGASTQMQATPIAGPRVDPRALRRQQLLQELRELEASMQGPEGIQFERPLPPR